MSDEIEEAEELAGDPPADVVEPEPQPEPEPPAWTPEAEAEARDFGWKSLTEWKGDVPPGYIDNPQDYLDRLERHTPFRKIREKYETLERTFEDRIRKTESAQRAMYERDLKRQQEDYEHRMRLIEEGKRRAAEEGDMERYDRFTKTQQGMKPPEPQELEPQPEYNAAPLAKDHPWLNDPIMRAHGAQVIDTAFRSGVIPPNASAEEQVKYAEEQVRRYFPHLFQQPEPEPQPKPKAKVDGGGLAGAGKRTGYDTLPKEARAAFEAQVKEGIFADSKEDREFYFNAYTNG